MSRRVLVDTHVVIDAGSTDGFKAMPLKVRQILEDADGELLLSVVSEAEVAIKTRIGKLDLTREEVRLICSNARISSYPLRREHIDRLLDLPLHYKDPFYRLIIASALSDDLTLISEDRRFRKYKGLRVIW